MKSFVLDGRMDGKSFESKLSIQVESDFKLNLICLDFESSSRKWEHMGIDDHLQASVIAGVIEKFRGSSNYLNDRPQPAQSTRTFVCRVKSRKDSLDLKTLNNQEDLAAHLDGPISQATHLVVGVTYGAEAYCVLTHDFSKKEEDREDDREEAEEMMSNIVSKMENALGENQDLDEFKQLFDDEEKRKLDRVKCRLYADLQSQSVRECCVFDAYKCCLKLIDQAQKTGVENSQAVPIAAFLLPLKVIASQVQGVRPLEYRDVDGELVTQCCRIWDHLERIVEMADVIRTTNKKVHRASLRHFREAVHRYQELFRKSFKNAILMARETADGDDEEVERVVRIAQSHPLFKSSRLERWLRYKQSESEILEKMANVKGVVFFANKIQLEREMADSFDKNFALVMKVPPLDEKTNTILEDMRDYLDNLTELLPGGYDEEDTDEEEEGDQLEEDGLPWHMIQRKRKQVMDKIREFAHHVENNKHLESQVQFYITSGEPGKGGCRYSVFEVDNLLKDNISQLPCPPTDLRAHLTTSSNVKTYQKSSLIRIEWNYKDLGYPCHFVVEFRLKGSSNESWKQRKTTVPGENQTTISFQSGTAMEIRVAAETCIGRSEFSDVIDTEFLIDANKDRGGEDNILSRVWSNNLQDAHPFFPSSPRRQQQQPSSSNNSRIAEIFAQDCSKHSQLIKQGNPSVYLLNAKEDSTGGDFRWFDISRMDFSPPPYDHRDHKIILLMGAAGSGKSTLIDGMVNYILGVQWKDPFRFKCVREDDLINRYQVNSQTNSVTAYTLRYQEGMAIPYSITIVETPGYGNTKGARRDKEITRKIQRFLTQQKFRIDQIHAVCFVAASNDIRSTSMQPYILDSVLSLFGKDVKDNIRLLVTFADMAHPPVVEACNAAKFPVMSSSGGIAYSKFDNSVLYAFNEQQDEDDFCFDELFWQMGQENYHKFFTMLEKMSGRDLASTREVIQRRLLLDQSLKDIERGLEVYLVNVENVQMFRRKIKEYSEKMEANQNFVIEKTEVRRMKVDCDRGFVAYNCRHCQRTCEGPMRSINFDYFRKTKKQCTHIFCPCPAFEHEYQQFQWRQVSEKVSTTLPEMKAEYESNYNDKVTTEKLLMCCLHELKVTKAKLFCLLARVGSSCLLLEATALRSNTLSLADYLSLMRSRVAEELAPGYLTRLEILKELQQSLARRSSESNALEILANSPINRNWRKMSCQSGEWQSIETFANSFAIDGYWS